MGKHNGKARPSGGSSVGSAFVNRAGNRVSRGAGDSAHRNLYTTDAGLQSNLDASDLTDLMDMAQLADRDFTAERGVAVVISNGAVAPLDKERSDAKRKEAEARNAHRLRVPRRPLWTPEMSAAAVDERERAAFLAWRRGLARLEEDEGLVLTPFEKNLEVWRQLWRVLERSHIVVQVVDARDPLMYRSTDLEAYARELHASKASLVLLNKADLLGRRQRAAWADHFDRIGVSYAFWSAKAAAEGHAAEGSTDPRLGVLTCEQLLEVFERMAEAARNEGSNVPKFAATPERPEGRLMVGLTGYPNVGKSSTINALFGSKKTTVSATPGKTKHFQTLNVGDRLTLVDCPGLVLPRYAASKAEMVAAGVIPIDRLTDVRGPIAVVAERVPRRQFEEAYGIRLPQPAAHEAPDRLPSASELLRAVAVARGWSAASGLPDETRAGRVLLKDFTAGKLLHARWPPGEEAAEAASRDEERSHSGGLTASRQEPSSGSDADSSPSSRQGPDASTPTPPIEDFGEADIDLLNSLQETGAQARPRRPDYKFHKKPARSKGRRGQEDDPAAYDGSAMRTGKHGGLVRVS